MYEKNYFFSKFMFLRKGGGSEKKGSSFAPHPPPPTPSSNPPHRKNKQHLLIITPTPHPLIIQNFNSCSGLTFYFFKKELAPHSN